MILFVPMLLDLQRDDVQSGISSPLICGWSLHKTRRVKAKHSQEVRAFGSVSLDLIHFI